MSQLEKEEKKSTVEVEEGKGWKRTLEIEVPKEKVDGEYQAAYKKYKDLSRIPGFRKGKAPMHLVKIHFKEKIDQEVLEALVPKAYEDAVKDRNMSPICLPVVKDIEFAEGSALKFKAEFEVQPEVEAKDYKGLEVVRRTKEITDKDVEAYLGFLREDLAELHPVQREAKLLDHLMVDLGKLQEGKEEKAENQEIVLDPANMVKEFQEALLNAKAGDKKEFEVDYPATFHNKNLAGKKVGYKIDVKEVKEKVLPEVNDSFAKTVGGYKTLDELKTKVKDGLVRKAQNDADEEVRNELANQVIMRNLFEVPETLLNFYLDSVVEDLKKKYRKVDEKKIREEYQEIAIGHIRWDILYHQIAEKEKIQVTKEDLEAWSEGYGRTLGVKAEEAKKALENPSHAKKIKEDILERKTLHFLRENGKIKEETFVAEEPKKEKVEPAQLDSKKT
ncbi:MAG: trigger factor [Candidatus Zixiibacteriota bacterium]